jgi:error-prone DNA polymerase
MTPIERTLADYGASGMTVGPHVMRHLRTRLDARGVTPAGALRRVPNGRVVRIAGHVIVRQRPGTAKGFLFLTIEDETGISNAVVTPNTFERWRSLVHSAPLLLVEGPVQNVEGVIHVRAERFEAIEVDGEVPPSHDFH